MPEMACEGTTHLTLERGRTVQLVAYDSQPDNLRMESSSGEENARITFDLFTGGGGGEKFEYGPGPISEICRKWG